MSKSAGFFIFIFGAAIGAAAAWKLAKTKYEAIANEEIASVKKAYHISDNSTVTYKDYPNPDIFPIKDETTYSQIIKTEKYTANSEPEPKEEIKYEDYPRPYIISPADFSENFEYDTVDITYFADGVLCDENNEPLEDIENTIGEDAVEHIGEFTPDTAYVRNERLKCDYEILRDERNYADIKKKRKEDK